MTKGTVINLWFQAEQNLAQVVRYAIMNEDGKIFLSKYPREVQPVLLLNCPRNVYS